MPQLDIVYISLIFLWTWLAITLILQKMTPLTITSKLNSPHTTNNQLTTPNLPWT